MRIKEKLKKFAGLGLAMALVAPGILSGAKMSVEAADQDEIMLGVFFTSEEDTSDVLYWSTDGMNFYELATAYKDSKPEDPNVSTIEFTEQDIQEYNKKYPYEPGRQPFNRQDQTFHDPSIMYYNGYFYMISGTDNKTTKTLDFYIGVSKDLVRWSYAGEPLSIAAPKEMNLADGNICDMGSPEFVTDGKDVYIVASLGYYANWHGDDPSNDNMCQYIVKVNNLGPGSGVGYDTKGNEVTTYLDTDRAIHVDGTLSDLKRIHIPCEDTRPASVTNNHIDGSFYIENGKYYYCVKEHGANNEIFSIDDLSKVSDKAAWTQVSYDVNSGYEGPSMVKFGGEYLMFTDRIAICSSCPDNPSEDEKNVKNGTAGIYVSRASVGTTGKLDKYTGWLNSNTRAVNFFDKSGNKKSAEYTGVTTKGGKKEEGVGGTYNGARHGTVITLKGEPAKLVRDLAKKTSNASKLDVNNVKWDDTGFYYQKSLREPVLGGYISRYWYEKDVRQGTTLTGNDRGKEINPFAVTGEDAWYWLDASRDGQVATARNKYNPDGTINQNSYQLGEYEVAMAVDWDAYNKLGSELYGSAAENWKWVRYNYFGRMIKNDTPTCPDRFYVSGNNGKLYRYDAITGGMYKGRYEWTNDEGFLVVNYFDPITGQMAQNMTVNVAGFDFYFDNTGALRSVNGLLTRFDDIPVEGQVNIYNYKDYLPVITYTSPAWKNASFASNGTVSIKASTTIPTNGWYTEGGKYYWYENGVRQGTEGRGKEINPLAITGEDAWYWLDAVQNGAVAMGKDLFQESSAGQWAERADGTGKWVLYDAGGHMIKGWAVNNNNIYYFDPVFGTMAKGTVQIDGVSYNFDKTTGVLIR